MTAIRAFPPKIRAFFPVFKKGPGRAPPSPSSYASPLKEIFSFQMLKISFSEIFLQKKPPHVSLVLLFYLRNKEVICKNEKRVL